MRDKIKDIISRSYHKALAEQKEFYLNGALIQVIDPLSNHVDINHIISFLKKHIPNTILNLVDVYYIGNFGVFKKKNTNAAYMDGAIYISSNQDGEKDLVDDSSDGERYLTKEQSKEMLSIIDKCFSRILTGNDYFRELARFWKDNGYEEYSEDALTYIK